MHQYSDEYEIYEFELLGLHFLERRCIPQKDIHVFSLKIQFFSAFQYQVNTKFNWGGTKVRGCSSRVSDISFNTAESNSTTYLSIADDARSRKSSKACECYIYCTIIKHLTGLGSDII